MILTTFEVTKEGMAIAAIVIIAAILWLREYLHGKMRY